MEILRFPSEEEARKAAEHELELILSNVATPTLLLLSGGSALKVLPKNFEMSDYTKLSIGSLDERYSQSVDELNHTQLKQTDFYQHCLSKGVVDLTCTPNTAESLEEFSERFSETIISWITQNPGGKILATLGMGEDGHTAGIMPYPEDPTLFHSMFDDESAWVKGYDAGNKSKFPKRVTVTNVFLKTKINSGVAYVVGENKKIVLDKLGETENIADTPARIWHAMKNVTVYTNIN